MWAFREYVERTVSDAADVPRAVALARCFDAPVRDMVHGIANTGVELALATMGLPAQHRAAFLVQPSELWVPF